MMAAETALDPVAIGVIFIALALGGLIKGATGAGAPVVAIPVMAAFFDPKLAVIIMTMPNLITNTWQLFRYRDSQLEAGFGWKFGLAGAIGVIVGTAILSAAPVEALSIFIAACVIGYIALRLAKPDLRLSLRGANKLVFPVGGVAGIFQGSVGISAPISISFLNRNAHFATSIHSNNRNFFRNDGLCSAAKSDLFRPSDLASGRRGRFCCCPSFGLHACGKLDCKAPQCEDI